MTRASQRVAKEIADYLKRSPVPRLTLEETLKRWLLMLAPPRKSVRRASPRTAKRRATVKELDALCREVVFKRDRGLCVWCCAPAVDWSHVYSRRYKWLRWDLDNSWAACKGCHLKWHHQPLVGAEFWCRFIGPQRYQALVLRAAKPRKTDPELVRAYLEAERKKL